MADHLVGLAASAVEYLSGKDIQKEADEHYKRDEAERAKKRVEEDLPKFKAKRLAKEEERAQEEYDRMTDEKERMKEVEERMRREEALEEAHEKGREYAHRRLEDEEMEDYEHFEK